MTFANMSDVSRTNQTIFLFDFPSLKFLYVNNYGCKKLGYRSEELLDMQLTDITVDPDLAPKIASLATTRTLNLVESSFQRKNGVVFEMQLEIHVLESQDGSLGLAIARDKADLEHRESTNPPLLDILEKSADFVGSADIEGNLTYLNLAAKRMIGLPDDADLTGIAFMDLFPEWARHQLSETAFVKLHADNTWRGETALLHRDGHEIPVSQTLVLHRDLKGQPLFTSTIISDLTERREKEEQLELLDYVFNHVNEAIFLVDENGHFVHVNEKACQSLGYTHEELLSMQIFDIDPDFNPSDWEQQKVDPAQNRWHATLETRHRTKRGQTLPVEVNASFISFQGRNYSLAIVRDVSERKAAQEQLSLLSYALNHVQEATWLINEHGKFLYCNAEACRALGYTQDVLLTLSVPDIEPDCQWGTWPQRWRTVKEKGSLIIESHHKTRGGKVFPVEINANYFEFRGQSFILALAHDISERKHSQQALQQSQQLLNEAQRIAHIGSWEVDFATDELTWTDETFRIWEVDPSQFGATVEAFLETVHPEDRDDVENAYNASVTEKLPYYIEHRLLFPDGRVKYVAERGEPKWDENGEVIRFVGTATDITERHYVEETLQFVAQRGWKTRDESFLVALSQYLARLFKVDYVVIDKFGSSAAEAETVVLYGDGKILPNMHYSLHGTPCADVMHGNLCCYSENVQALFPDDRLLVEMRAESYAGLPLWDTSGKVIGLIAVIDSKPLPEMDFVSSILRLVATSCAAELERQHAEQTLLSSRHFLNQIINTLADPVFVKDREHRWVLLNQAFCDFIGQPLDCLLGKSDYDFFPETEADVFWAKDEEVFSTGLENANEEQFTDSKGVCRTIITKKTRYEDHNSELFLVGLIIDITERKKMEQEIAAREQEFRILVETAPSPIFRYDTNCRRIYLNPAVEKMTEKAAEELLGRIPSDASILSREEGEKLERTLRQVIATGEATEGELECVFANGETHYFHNRYAPELNADNQVVSVILISHDITKRKLAEQLLQQREQEFRTLAENIPDSLIRFDKLARISYLNRSVTRSLGTELSSVFGKTLNEAHPESRLALEADQIIRQVIASGEPVEQEIEIELADGDMHIQHVRYVAERNNDGYIIGALAIGRDVTERKRMEAAVRQREQEFRALVDNLPTVVIRYDRNLSYVYGNTNYLQLIGCSDSELRTRTIEQNWLATNISAESYKRVLRKVLNDGEKLELSLEWKDRNGNWVSYAVRIVPEYTLDGRIQTVLVLGFDFSDRYRQQVIESKRQRVYEEMARNGSLDVILRLIALYVESVKEAGYCAILLFGEHGNELQLTVAPSFPSSYWLKNQNFSLTDKTGLCHGWATSAQNKERVIIKNLREQPCIDLCGQFIREIGAHACWSEPIISSSGQLLGVVTLYLQQPSEPTDLDLAHLLKAARLSAIAVERQRIERQMIHQASYDALTELPNRCMFYNRLREEIKKAERDEHSVAVLFIDLDRFKDVNDTLGHALGDSLLTNAARRISDCVRQSDLVARLGGDEFVVILPCTNTLTPSERIVGSIIDAMAEPFILNEYRVYVSASVGISIYPQDAVDVETLVSCADQAMYAAKESGRNNFCFFTRGMQERAQQRLYLINALREALKKEQLHVYYQPVFEAASGKAVKAEALLRWHHPVLGSVSPAEFIPLAEETDLIQDIGGWVFRQAADMAKRWNLLDNDHQPRKISVNMSPRQLIKGDGDRLAIEYLQTIDLSSNHLVIEITEGLLLDNSPNITKRLDRLRAAGVELALDDFGTGYSAMAYLKKFNINYLKIDRSFVRELATNLDDQAIIEAIIVMAHRLSMKVIAEGIETEDQCALLTALGCEYIQGYLYAKPMPADVFLSFVTNAGTARLSCTTDTDLPLPSANASNQEN